MRLAILALLLGSASAFLPSPAVRRASVAMKAQDHDTHVDRRSALVIGGAAWLSGVVPARALGSVLGDLSPEDKAAAEAILSGEAKARATKAPEPAAAGGGSGGGGSLLNLQLPEKKPKEPAEPKAPKEKKEKKEKATRGSAFDRVKVVEKPKEEAVYAEGEDPFEVARQKREEKRKKAEETFDRKKNNMSAMEQFKGRPIGRD
eukprot:CAMPEP_0119543770 /NCGR_PEP_ID=MMETSP1344-20130328/54335_1 /TAXON_ID=236787 /ORGANISM="Florenciella parvula, Strain CCMP2471" /LENGTH=203 /DNA_ID=CAMNT_0007588153 /DNA_START=64 /DNA_END=675 /DNA_ORIENTATION=+